MASRSNCDVKSAPDSADCCGSERDGTAAVSRTSGSAARTELLRTGERTAATPARRNGQAPREPLSDVSGLYQFGASRAVSICIGSYKNVLLSGSIGDTMTWPNYDKHSFERRLCNSSCPSCPTNGTEPNGGRRCHGGKGRTPHATPDPARVVLCRPDVRVGGPTGGSEGALGGGGHLGGAGRPHPARARTRRSPRRRPAGPRHRAHGRDVAGDAGSAARRGPDRRPRVARHDLLDRARAPARRRHDRADRVSLRRRRSARLHRARPALLRDRTHGGRLAPCTGPPQHDAAGPRRPRPPRASRPTAASPSRGWPSVRRWVASPSP